MNQRLNDLKTWLVKALSSTDFILEEVAGDASFRSYYRVKLSKQSYIVMDAPPEKEPCARFINLGQQFRALGITVPKVYHADQAQGFVLLTDFGDTLLIKELNTQNADRFYQQAMEILIRFHSVKFSNSNDLLTLGQESMWGECELFTEWFLKRHLQVELPITELQKSFESMITNAIAQEQVCIHRDYHSCNLLVLSNEELGIIDFQDASMGAISYDAVSLLRDCYIDWPSEKVENWAAQFCQMLNDERKFRHINQDEFIRNFDFAGIQRHIKAIGIFSRLKYRDSQPQFLQYIPRALNYIEQVAAKYPEMHNLAMIFQEVILPKWREGAY